jgi:flagellar hook-associated protein 1
MLGRLGILNPGARSLQVQQTGVEVAGQNLANINNSAYARQRLQTQTSVTIPTQIGSQGTGVQAVAMEEEMASLITFQNAYQAALQSTSNILQLQQSFLSALL